MAHPTGITTIVLTTGIPEYHIDHIDDTITTGDSKDDACSNIVKLCNEYKELREKVEEYDEMAALTALSMHSVRAKLMKRFVRKDEICKCKIDAVNIFKTIDLKIFETIFKSMIANAKFISTSTGTLYRHAIFNDLHPFIESYTNFSDIINADLKNYISFTRNEYDTCGFLCTKDDDITHNKKWHRIGIYVLTKKDIANITKTINERYINKLYELESIVISYIKRIEYVIDNLSAETDVDVIPNITITIVSYIDDTLHHEIYSAKCSKNKLRKFLHDFILEDNPELNILPKSQKIIRSQEYKVLCENELYKIQVCINKFNEIITYFRESGVSSPQYIAYLRNCVELSEEEIAQFLQYH